MTNILFCHTNDYIKGELQELVTDLHGSAFFAATVEEAVTILHTHPIDILFFELREIGDAGLLKYTNDHFNNVRIILTVESGMLDAIATIKNVQFEVLQEPLVLKELRAIVRKLEVCAP